MADSEIWKLLVNWLKQERITKNSVKFQIDKVDEAEKLYLYLKDGVELNRILAFVLQQPELLNNIQHSQIQDLQEENIRTFILAVKQNFDFDIFTTRRLKVFSSFEYLDEAIQGISGLSQRIQKRYGIPGFKVNSSSLRVSKYWKRNTYPNRRYSGMQSVYGKDDADEYGIYDDDYDHLYETIMGSEGTPSLEFSIEELQLLNTKYIDRVLKIFKYWADRNRNDILGDNFFPNFKIDLLLEVHKALEEDLKILDVSVASMCPFFTLYQSKFLIYADIAIHVNNSNMNLKDLVIKDADIEKEIQHFSSITFGSSGLSYNLFDLMQMFLQHLMRYPLVLASIQHYAEKSGMKEVEKSARTSCDLMTDIVKHVEKYVNDYQNIKDIRKLMEKISYLPKNYDYDSNGFLKNTLELEKLRFLSSGREYTNVTMLCFEKKIVFYSEDMIYDMRTYISEMENCFLHASKSKNSITLDSYRTGLEKEESVILDLSSTFQSTIEEIFQKLKELFCREKQKKKMLEKPNLTLKILDITQGEDGDTRISGPTMCNFCKRWIGGLILEIVVCSHCSGNYHVDCVLNNEDIHLQTDDEDEQTADTCTTYIHKEDEFLVDKPLSREDSEQMLDKKVGGSFLVRRSKNSHQYVITAKATREQIYEGKGKYSHYQIQEIIFKQQKYYYIRKREAFSSFLELVVYHQNDFGLLYPLKHEVADDYHPEWDSIAILSESIYNQSQEIDINPFAGKQQQEYHATKKDIFDRCFWGTISSDIANAMLRDKAAGTFLTRWSQSNSQYCISVKTKSNVKHYVLWKNDKQEVYINSGEKKKFESKEDLIEYYTSIDFLTYPLLQRNYEDEDKRIPDIICQEMRLSFYHGDMEKSEANELLGKELPGTYLLRKNKKQDLVLSFKSRDLRLVHEPIMVQDRNYIITIRRGQESFDSVDKAVLGLKHYYKELDTPLHGPNVRISEANYRVKYQKSARK